jgi:hypothetical protein
LETLSGNCLKESLESRRRVKWQFEHKHKMENSLKDEAIASWKN